jgi:phage gp29-like protein
MASIVTTTTSPILDSRGRPIVKEVLTQSISGPTTRGVRQPLSGYPGDGLNPRRLGSILREADQGDPLRYFELAETIEERDLHYAGVLGTRKRTVAQIDISVEPAAEDQASVDQAKMIEDWLKRDELADELFDILDAIGKGISHTEIIWDTSSGQWRPRVLEWRDPRWFRPNRADLATPMLIGENGQEEPLPGGKFIQLQVKAKSGLYVRSGLARVAMWAYMFKKFTERDWAIFTQTYGQPLRIGTYHPQATEEDKDTLFNAVSNIAGDCAAIIPAGMTIEFQHAAVAQSADLYEKRADWYDKQVSKLVLGQTATTDSVTGGLGSGKEHRQVQEDIERADARVLAAAINRDLVRTWIDLEYGPRTIYPRVIIARPDEEDLKQLTSSVSAMVPLGLRVSQKEMRSKLGLSEPAAGEEILSAPASPAITTTGTPGAPGGAVATGSPKRLAPPEHGAESAADPGDLEAHAVDVVLSRIATGAGELAGAATDAITEQIGAVVAKVNSLEELQAELQRLAPELSTVALQATMQQALLLARLTGRLELAGD